VKEAGMSEVTVSQLAADVGISVDRLLQQLADAGITKQAAEDAISEQEKMNLLNHLRSSHGKKEAAEQASAPNKITLKRKTTTELRQPTGTGGRATARGAAVRPSKTVSVEVRRKRTYVKREEVDESEELKQQAEEALKALAEQQEQRKEIDAEVEARRQAEEDRRKAEDAERVEAEEAKRKVEETARQQAEEEARLAAEEAQRARLEAEKLKAVEGKTQKPAKKAKRERQAPAEAGAPQRRKELHVSADKRGKRKSAKGGRRSRAVTSGDQEHGFQRPVERVVKDIKCPKASQWVISPSAWQSRPPR